MFDRRRWLQTLGAGLVGATHFDQRAQAQTAAKPFGLVDTNVSLFHWPFRRLPFDSADRLVNKLGQLGIVEAWASGLDALLHRDVSAVNERLWLQCAKHKMLRPVGAVNFALPGWERDLQQCAEGGMHAIRIYPSFHGYDLADAGPLLTAAESAELILQIVVIMEDPRTQHRLARVPETDLAPLAALAKGHPKLAIQLLNYRPRAADMQELARCSNVYFDTSRVESVDGVPRLVDQVSARRVLFGSLAPLLIPEAAVIRVHESGELSSNQLQAVYGDSARRMEGKSGRGVSGASVVGLPSTEQLQSYQIWDSYFTPSHSHPGKDGERLMAEIQRALPVARKAHFQRLCYFAHVGIGTTTDAALERELRENPERVLAPLQRWPELLIGMIQLNAHDVQASLAAVDRWLGEGPMLGVYFPGGGPGAMTCTHKNMLPLVERIAELKGVIMQHTWFKTGGKQGPGESTPSELAELAKQFPQQKFLCAHAGGEWQRGIRAVRHCENVLVETSGFDATAGFIEMAVRELGAERVVFGSHLPSRSLGTELAKVVGADISERQKRLILGENYRKLLQPIMARHVGNSKATGQ